MKTDIVKIGIVLVFCMTFFSYSLYAWGPVKRLSWTAEQSHYPTLAIDSTNIIYVVWDEWDEVGSLNGDIFFKKSSNGGNTWSTRQQLTFTAAHTTSADIACDSSDNIHLVWEDKTPGNHEIYYKNSTDSGASWSVVKRLSWTAIKSIAPSIAIDGSDVIHVIWIDNNFGNYELVYKSSADGGATWSAPLRMTFTPGDSLWPHLQAENNTLHVVWQDGTGFFDIYYKMSLNGGATWSSPTRLTWTAAHSGSAKIALESVLKVHLVYMDPISGNYEIYYKRSIDGGKSWFPPVRLTWNPGWSGAPFVAAYPSGKIGIVWSDDSIGFPSSAAEIFYKQSNNSGVTWSGTTRITWNTDVDQNPKLAFDSTGILHLVWEGQRSYWFDIFYKNHTL